MINHIALFATLTMSAAAPVVLPTSSLSALHAFEDPSLGTMRAGSPVAERPLTESERETLRNLDQREAPALSNLRAGEMSNSDWQTVGWIALVVLVLVILL
ncbi:MAG: hypothetical protein SGI72_11480 [Planctomycetota bacterium]|nr:hypothetical protein [Planctomycetota bacterium]